MNTRSSTSHQGNAGNQDRLSGVADTIVRSAGKLQKRWQPKSRRPEERHRLPIRASRLSQLDNETTLRQYALKEAQQGNHATAIALFTQILSANPQSARDYNNRGLVYFQSGELDKAIADYNRALRIDDTLDSVYNNRANYYAAQGKFLEAILDYDAALDLNPANGRAWLNQGITLRELRMFERAVECFDFALRLGRLESHIYAERGRTYHVWGDWNCALADYQRAIDSLNLPTAAAVGTTTRLRLQLEVWKDELLSPLGGQDEGYFH